MRYVAPEFTQWRTARPGVEAVFRSQKGALRVLRQRKPEAGLIGTGGHVVDEGVVRIGDPVSRHRVVGRQQRVRAGHAGLPDGLTTSADFAVGSEIDRYAGLAHVALHLDRQVVHVLIAGLDAVFEEETVTNDVVSHVVFHAHVVGAMHGDAAVEGVVDRGVLDVLAFAGFAHQMPVNRIARQFKMLTHAIELNTVDEHFARHHRHDVTTEESLGCIFRCLDLDVAGQQAHFASLIHVEGDRAEVHVIQFFIERNRVAADGSDGAPLGLTRIKVGRRQHNLVTDFPLFGVHHLDRRGASLSSLRQLGPGVGARTVQVQRAARQHDAAITHAHQLFVFDVVGESDSGVVRVWLRFSTNLQFAMHHDPLSAQR